MELTEVQIETSRSTMLPEYEEALVLPLGDIQLDPKLRGRERSCDIDRLKKHIAWGVEHNAYWLGMGDYVDVASPSNRDIIRRSGFYDNVSDALEEQALQTLDELKDMLKPTQGRWLGLLEGHHFYEFASGMTTDMLLADYLGCAHLGTSTMVRVKFPAQGHKAAPSFVIWAHHGRGAGQMLSSPLNQLENVLKAFDADVYFVGHHHKKVAGKYNRLSMQGSKLVHKNVILACTGSFLRGYQQGSRRGLVPRGSYVEQGMMNPVALGGVAVWARPKIKHGYSFTDLDVSF